MTTEMRPSWSCESNRRHSSSSRTSITMLRLIVRIQRSCAGRAYGGRAERPSQSRMVGTGEAPPSSRGAGPATEELVASTAADNDVVDRLGFADDREHSPQ